MPLSGSSAMGLMASNQNAHFLKWVKINHERLPGRAAGGQRFSVLTPKVQNKMLITQSVNTIIQIEMEERNLSRADMARELGISPQTVTIALNNPARDWKITTLDDWATALNCNLHIEFRPRKKRGKK